MKGRSTGEARAKGLGGRSSPERMSALVAPATAEIRAAGVQSYSGIENDSRHVASQPPGGRWATTQVRDIVLRYKERPVSIDANG
jgi:hypothetical protein